MGEFSGSQKRSVTKSKNVREITAAEGEQPLTEQQQGFIESTLPGFQKTVETGQDLLSQILSGQPLGGTFAPLTDGISEEAIANQAANITAQNMAGFQNLGIADSGVAFRETAEDIAGKLLLPAEQQQQAVLQNLLQLALGGLPAFTQPVLGTQELLAQRLAGLRATTDTGKIRSRQTEFGFKAEPAKIAGALTGNPATLAG